MAHFRPPAPPASLGERLARAFSAALVLLLLGCRNAPLLPGAAGIDDETADAAAVRTPHRGDGKAPAARAHAGMASSGAGVATAYLPLSPAPLASGKRAARQRAPGNPVLAAAASGPRAAPHAAAPSTGAGGSGPPGLSRAGVVAATGSSEALAEVCVGRGHSCVRTRNGRVACWGDNTEHQVATSDESQIERPRWVEELPASASLRCGGAETCIRTQAGDVYCLGGDRVVEKVALGEVAVDLAESASGGCAALQSGRVMCWQQPKLGSPSGEAERDRFLPRTPRQVQGMKVTRGFATAPALASRICTSTSQGPVCTSEPPAADDPARGPVGVNVAPPGASLAGASRLALVNRAGTMLCGLLGTDRLRCAGDGPGRSLVASGDLTLDASLRRPDESEESGAAPDFDGVVAAYDGGLCLRAPGGLLRCVGEPNELVVNIPAEARFAAIGVTHGCALTEQEVSCWGAAGRGQLGSGPSYLRREPTAVPGIEDARAIAGTETRACVLRGSGQLWCWGEGSARGDTEGIQGTDYSPRPVSTPEPLLELRTVPPSAPAASRAAAAQGPVLAGAEAAVCARGTASWLCLGARGLQPQAAFSRDGIDGPVLPGSAPQPVHVARDGRCGVTASGNLICALAPRQPASSPTARRSLKRFAAPEGFVEATPVFPLHGAPHVCGRTRAGRVECFMLDDGASSAAATARDRAAAGGLAALDGIVQLDAAASGEGGVACALDAAGRVWCWGAGRWGQRPGAGTEGAVDEPLPIDGLPPIARVVVGSTFVCARAAEGRVYCWGSNRDGGAPDGASGVAREAQRVQLPL